MAEGEVRLPDSEVERVALRWKSRRGNPRQPNAKRVYGSYEVTLPKERVQRFGWYVGQELEARFGKDRITLSSVPALVPGAGAPPSPTSALLDRIRCGDVLESMRLVPSASVHMAITSPPYNVGAGYAGYSDTLDYDDYRAWLRKVWVEVKRVLVPGGRFALNIAPTSISNYKPVHMDMSSDVEEAGLSPRAEILWYKQNMTAKRTAWGSFQSPRHPHVIPSWEYVLIFQNEQPRLIGSPQDIDITRTEFIQWSNGMWSIPPETTRYADHPAAFPEELITRLVKYYTYRGNTIMDMFGGTGTVAVVARNLGRHFIHIDKSRAYCDAAEARLAGRFVRGRRTKQSQRSLVKGRSRSERTSVVQHSRLAKSRKVVRQPQGRLAGGSGPLGRVSGVSEAFGD
jgi:modification methylase